MVLKTIHSSLTCWCLKNVRNETQARPICKNICLTLVKEPPVQSTAIHIRKFPANILVPGINGWLLHTNYFRHLELVQIVLMTIAVPHCSAFTSGVLPVRQIWQNWKSNNSLDMNTMCFGSVLMSWVLDKGILHEKKNKVSGLQMVWFHCNITTLIYVTWVCNAKM